MGHAGADPEVVGAAEVPAGNHQEIPFFRPVGEGVAGHAKRYFFLSRKTGVKPLKP